ncbi:MAG TPA: sulfite exporter TauE/SafE family protein [Bacteroidetes bacterium]|nr:sulfite exporter TauE/SafE family protein [Bacteroidota bacterium]
MIFHSPFEFSYLWLPLIGFIVGLFGTMIGGGGGFFFLPVLTLLFHVPPHTAVATSLAATLPICIVGTAGHYRNGNIYPKIGLIFALAGLLGALTGAGTNNFLTSGQLKTGFGIYSILIALHIGINHRKMMKSETNRAVVPDCFGLKKTFKATFFGFLAGFITGTFGTSGTAPVLAGLFSIRIPVKLVIGTSLMIIFVNTLFALGAHFLVGEIDLTLVYFLTAGALIGAFSGPRLLAGIHLNRMEGTIRKGYALIMIGLGILMIIS